MGNPLLDDSEEQHAGALAGTGFTPEELAQLGQVPDMNAVGEEEVLAELGKGHESADPTPDEYNHGSLDATLEAAGASEPPGAPVAPKDPNEDVKARLVRHLLSLKGPSEHADNGKMLSADGAGKVSQALYHAGTGTALPDSFFVPKDHDAEEMKKAMYEVQRAKAIASLMGKGGAGAGGKPENADLIRYIETTRPDLAKKLGPALYSTSAKDLSLILADTRASETDQDKHGTEATKTERYNTEQERKKQAEEVGPYVDSLVAGKHPALEGNPALQEALRGMPLAKAKAAIQALAPDAAATTRETQKTLEDTKPIDELKAIADRLTAQHAKYGDAMPGVGTVTGQVNAGGGLGYLANKVGNALGVTKGSPEEGVQNQIDLADAKLVVERLKGGQRMASSPGMQQAAAQVTGLNKDSRPEAIYQAVKNLQAAIDESLASEKRAHPKAAARLDAAHPSSSGAPAADIDAELEKRFGRPKVPAVPAPATASEPADMEHPTPPPGKKLQYNKKTGQYRLVDEGA